jgi:hypothetical protein
MRILIRYSDNTAQAAMLLATIGSRVRAAVPGCDDAVEFTRTGERWLGEDGRPVDIEFDAAEDSAEWSVAADAATPQGADAEFELAEQCWGIPAPVETVPAQWN